MRTATRVVTVSVAALVGGLVAATLAGPPLHPVDVPARASSGLFVVGTASADRADRTGDTSRAGSGRGPGVERGPRLTARPAGLGVDPPGPAPVPGASVPGATVPGASRAGPPTILRVDAVGLRVGVQPEGVAADGSMALPETPRAIGWYRFGPGPRDGAGAVVLAGHVDTAEEGIGPLAMLATLSPGDRVALEDRRGVTTYAVTSVRRVPKAVLDTAALFARTGPPRLHLVTCGGDYLPDAGGYQDNLIVVARRLPDTGPS